MEGGACAPPSFGISVNPIRTKGADYARRITTDPPIFLDDAASLSDGLYLLATEGVNSCTHAKKTVAN